MSAYEVGGGFLILQCDKFYYWRLCRQSIALYGAIRYRNILNSPPQPHAYPTTPQIPQAPQVG